MHVLAVAMTGSSAWQVQRDIEDSRCEEHGVPGLTLALSGH